MSDLSFKLKEEQTGNTTTSVRIQRGTDSKSARPST